jgi:hypothetical protein
MHLLAQEGQQHITVRVPDGGNAPNVPRELKYVGVFCVGLTPRMRLILVSGIGALTKHNIEKL